MGQAAAEPPGDRDHLDPSPPRRLAGSRAPVRAEGRAFTGSGKAPGELSGTSGNGATTKGSNGNTGSDDATTSTTRAATATSDARGARGEAG